jgi:2-polyprenyl-3-methyl-5-hydroxy-6-metoxy-1,4-benzoquinol methylase
MINTPKGKLLPAEEYAHRHDADMIFEQVCIQARQNCNIRFLKRFLPSSILEVGCGPLSLLDRVQDEGIPFTDWVIVEPAPQYVMQASLVAAPDQRVNVIEGYLENSSKELSRLKPSLFDAVILSSLIHETSEPATILATAWMHLKPEGMVLVSVPNALSFHRLLAVELGLITSPDTITERNLLLGQPVVYTSSMLQDLMTKAGFVNLALEGYLFKPFTHKQMESLMPLLGEGAVAALDKLGRKFPDNAAEICCIGRKAV